MKRILKYFARIIALALAAALAVILYPHVSKLISDTILSGKIERTATILNQEMKKAGELTAVRHTEEGWMAAKIDAALIGTVGQVKAPYSYEIGLGFSLADVQLKAEEGKIQAILPSVRMLHEQFQITGSPEVSDVWQLLTEQRYQQMIDQQAKECRERYLNQPEYLDSAWQAACEQLEELFSRWAGDEVSVFFVRQEVNAVPEENHTAA